MSDGRWRDLFPLPSISTSNISAGSEELSVGAKRRAIKRANNVLRANDVIGTLNEMAGHGAAPPAKPSKAQCAQHQLLCQVARSPKSATHVQLREGVHELLHLGLSSYVTEEEARSTVRSYSKGLVSLPAGGAQVFDARELLDETGRGFLLEITSILLDCLRICTHISACHQLSRGPFQRASQSSQTRTTRRWSSRK